MNSTKPDRYGILGVEVAAVQIDDVVRMMTGWIEEKDHGHYIAVTNTHVVTESWLNPEYKKVLNSADIVVPDGMPLVWLGRLSGYPLKRRVYGPELMEGFLRETGPRYRHFLYGGMQGIPEKISERLSRKYPGLRFVGSYSPPFRSLTEKEEGDIVDMINDIGPDVLWVGLGAPRQEIWMYEHAEVLRVPVMVGVGAAFDFLAGAKPQAPLLFRENGFEWLWRLLSEPRRLWRRYLLYGPLFIGLVMLEKTRILKF
ncbi:MAG: WecB/TagA/CpsF family glycosyltransferase [Thermodesulfobacteriota bacterium]